MVRLRRENPVLRRRRFLEGTQVRGSESSDITWFNASGREMQDADWHSPKARVFGERLNGNMLNECDTRGRAIHGKTLTILYNASEVEVQFVLPGIGKAQYWWPIVDTSCWRPGRRRAQGGEAVSITARSIIVLQLQTIRPSFMTPWLLAPMKSADSRPAPKLFDAVLQPRKSA
jgi:glycogen operon protein